MAEFVKIWNDAGSLTVSYDGDRDGSAVFSSDVAEGLDREMSVSFVDKSRSVVVERKVLQTGMREIFNAADGEFLTADGETFNVLKPDVPEGYTEIDYLQGDGVSWVDTGFCPSFQTKIVADVSSVDVSFLWGVRDTSGGTSPRQFGLYRRNTTSIRAYYFGTNADASVSDTSVRSSVIQDGNSVSAYGITIKNTTVTSGVTTYPLYIFGLNTAGAVSGLSTMRLFSMKIYDNDVLVRDCVPCIDPNGIKGLWCKVSETFYPLTNE